MGFFDKNNQREFSPGQPDKDEPVKNFIILISLILTAPLILIYKLFRGGIKNSFVVVILILAVIYGLHQLSKHNITKRDIKTKIIQQTLEELTPEEKEEMRNEVSTLRKSIGEEKVPAPLAPLLDVPVDMLSINYLYFMIQSGYIKPNGEGAEFILDSYLHSNHRMLKEKSWQALGNINTEASERVRRNYETEAARKKAKLDALKKEAEGNGVIEDIKFDIKDQIQKLRDKTHR